MNVYCPGGDAYVHSGGSTIIGLIFAILWCSVLIGMTLVVMNENRLKYLPYLIGFTIFTAILNLLQFVFNWWS